MSEEENLDFALEMLISKMKQKMLKKADQGYSGWDDPSNTNNFIKGLFSHVTKAVDAHQLSGDREIIEQAWVDVANFAMMLFYANLERGSKHNER